MKIRRIRTKFLLPILALQLVALAALGVIGYRFAGSILRDQSEREFRTAIDGVYTAVDGALKERIAKIESFASDPIFIKFFAAPQYKSDADGAAFDFQRGGGLMLGEPEVGGLVNYPVGLLANVGNRKILQEGLFPSIEYVGIDGFVRLHVYLGGSNDADFEAADRTKLGRSDEPWFEAAKRGEIFVGPPQKMKIFLCRYEPVSFEREEVAIEKELIPIAVPHRVGSQIKGIFLVTTTPGFIREALAAVQTRSLLVILGGGEEIGSAGDERILKGSRKDLFVLARETPPDAIEEMAGWLVMHREVPTSKWSILMVGDRNSLYGSVFAFRNRVILIMALSLAVMAAFIFVVVRRSLAPVLTLTKASDRIAGGELGVVIPRETDDEIGRLTESFNQMSVRTKGMHDRLSRMNFVRRQLLGIISHEIRTPLNSVVCFYDLIEAELSDGAVPADPEEFTELFVHLGESIERCKVLVERLTKASSAIAAELRPDEEMHERARLRDVLAAASAHAGKQSEERRIAIRLDCRTDAEVACPEGALRLMIEEALSNAVKYSPDGGTVEVSAEAADGMAAIVVEDHGPGIKREYLEEVVEPFFEVQDADLHSTGRFKGMGGGLGLGLTIILSVLRQYQGSFEIDSPPEEGGTIISMKLPLAHA